MPRAAATPTRAPATRDQADAYRFGLRRLEAALVRGDPVPLHEQIRSQRRASGAGIALGALGVAGFLVYGLIVPAPDWRNQPVVVGADSGALYVVEHQPDRLVPVANLPAARLVLAALRSGGSSAVDPATARPVTVPDAELDTAARTPTAAVPGAVAVRPDATITPRWALCDTVDLDGRLVGTTVVGGATDPAADAGDAALLQDSDATIWLVTDGHRYRVDVSDAAVLLAFGLTPATPRRAVSAELLSALPEGPALVVPAIERRGDPAPDPLPGQIGDVLVTHPASGADRYFVVLSDGAQEVPQALADLMQAASGATTATAVPAALLAGHLVEHLPVAGWPARTPVTRGPQDDPVLCWRWSPDGDQAGTVALSPAMPIAPGVAPVVLAQADGPGPLLDAVAVGGGGAVRATGPGRAAGAGPVWLVSASGVGYGVADAATAEALGVTTVQPAPDRALRLLPAGPALDIAAAGRAMDVLPQE